MSLLLVPQISFAARSTHAYVKRNGTFVTPYLSSTPNATRADNWSAKGNINPITGKKGYERTY